MDILGYPEAAFPPTDLHTATLLDGKIILIGNFGYGKHTRDGTTQIAELDVTTFAIRLIHSTGSSPGWIHHHAAELGNDQNSIVVRGGLVEPGTKNSPGRLENPDTWALDLSTCEWKGFTQSSMGKVHSRFKSNPIPAPVAVRPSPI